MPTRSASKRKTMRLSPDHIALLSAFNEHNVQYLVIGGYAVGFHSEPRSTKDLDVFVRSNEENSVAVFRALASFGAPLSGLTPADFRDGTSYFQMGFPPEQVDVLQTIAGVNFDESWESRTEVLLNGKIRVPVISADKLIANKLAAGRPRDLLDVEDIREAQAEVPSQQSAAQTVALAGWEVGLKKVALVGLLRKHGGCSLSEAKGLVDKLLEGAPVNVKINTADFDWFAFRAKKLGVQSVTRVL